MSADHPIVITPHQGKVRVLWRGNEIVNTDRALSLKESVYPAVIYVPREDADMRFFARVTRTTTCPHKGVANYFSLRADGVADENSVWTYEAPKADVAAIAGHLAFYPDKVEFAAG